MELGRPRSKLVWFAAFSVAFLVALPPMLATGRTELTVSAMYDEAATELPDKTTLLRTESSVARAADGVCRVTVARQLATELDTGALNQALDSRLAPGGRNASFAAWFHDRKLVVRRLGSSERVVFDSPQAPGLPPAARKLATAYAMLPEGVRRVVLYETRVLDEPWELRCL